MKSHTLITVDPEILGGTPVFAGTRVPVNTLFEYLEDDYSLEEFLECFPTVTRAMACRVLERSASPPSRCRTVAIYHCQPSARRVPNVENPMSVEPTLFAGRAG